MELNDTVNDRRSAPVIGEPDVCNVHHYGHDRIKEYADLSPPSCPYYKLSSDYCIQASKTRETQSPNINVLTIRHKHVVILENSHRNIEYYQRVDKANNILEEVVFPGK